MKTLLIIALLLPGCANLTRVVVMQNPETKQTVYCNANGAVSVGHGRQIDPCVKAHTSAGYVKVSDSED